LSGVVLDLHFLTFLENLFQFSQDAVFSGRELLSMPSSISAFAQVIRTFYEHGGTSDKIDFLMVADALELVKWAACAAAMVSLALTRKNEPIEEAMAVSIVVMTNLGVWVGGYSFILYIVAVPIFLRMRLRWIYLGIILLILSPLDAITIVTDNIGPRFSYLSGAQLVVIWQLALGTLLRPLLNFGLMLAITLEMLLVYMKITRTPTYRMTPQSNVSAL
jgi:hypothetical protein